MYQEYDQRYGFSITGGPRITYPMVSGMGGMSILYGDDHEIIFSGGGGGAGGDTFVTNNYHVNSGSGLFVFQTVLETGIDKKFIPFPSLLDFNPTILNSLKNDTTDNILGVQTSGTTPSGYWAIFTDTISHTGYTLHSFAANSTGTGLATTIIINNITTQGGASNLTGLISTGSADLRYLQTGVSGEFLKNSNLNGLTTSGSLESTGTSLQNQVNTERNKNSVTGVSISGDISITGALNINAGNNIVLTQAGSNILTINSVDFSINKGITGSGTFGYIPRFANQSGIITGSIYDNGLGKLGIGTNDPSYTIDINGGTGSEGDLGVRISNSDGANMFFGKAPGLSNRTLINNMASQPMDFQVGGSDQMTITNGQVVIGRNNLGGEHRLGLYNTNLNTSLLSLTNTGVSIGSYTAFTFAQQNDNFNYAQLRGYSQAAGHLGALELLVSSGSKGNWVTGLRLTANGNIGINNISPIINAKLDVSGNIYAVGGKVLTSQDSGNLQTQIDLERNKKTVTGISISGGNSMTGAINIFAGSNITLIQSGSNSFIFSSAGGSGIAGSDYSTNGITGLVVTGSNAISGNILITGGGTITTLLSGKTIVISNPFVSLNGLISTGSADLRYLTTGASGAFYASSNPSNYITNANLNGLISTGSADLRYLASGASGLFYLKTNPNNFSSSGNVENTGTSLQNQINNLTNVTGLYVDRRTNQLVSGEKTFFNGIITNDNLTNLSLDSNQRILVGSVSGVDWGLITESVTESEDYGSIISSVTESEDYGDFLNISLDWKNKLLNGEWDANNLLINGIQVTTGGPYYPTNNPSNYINIINSGSLQQNLESTGTSLQNQLNTERNKNSLTGVSITGGISITGALNINAGSNITLTQAGANIFSISSSAGGGSSILNGITGSGSGNYICKFNLDGSGIINSVIFNSGNNVGIGTTNPLSQFEINSSTQGTLDVLGAAGGNLRVGQGSAVSNGYVSLAYTNPKLGLTRTASHFLWYDTSNGNVVFNNTFGGASNLKLQYGGNDVVDINSSRNVGIGTTSPISKLDVSGNIFASGGKVLTALDSGNINTKILNISGLSIDSEPNVLIIHPNGTCSGFYGRTDAEKGSLFTGALFLAKSGDLIRLGPGNFEVTNLYDSENELYNPFPQLSSGVFLIGQGKKVTKIIADSTQQLISLAGDNIVSDLSILNTNQVGGGCLLCSPENNLNYTGFFDIRNVYLSGLLDCIGTIDFLSNSYVNIENTNCFGRDDTCNGTAKEIKIKNSTFSIEKGGVGRNISFQLLNNQTGAMFVQDCVFEQNVDNNNNRKAILFSGPTGSSFELQNCIIKNNTTGNGVLIDIHNAGTGLLSIDSSTIFNLSNSSGVITQKSIFGTNNIDFKNRNITGNWNIQSGNIIGFSTPPIRNSGATLNLGVNSFYIHTGNSNDYWILPTAAGSPGRFYFIKNKGANITLSGNSSTERLFTTTEVLNITIASGESYIVGSDSEKTWMIM